MREMYIVTWIDRNNNIRKTALGARSEYKAMMKQEEMMVSMGEMDDAPEGCCPIAGVTEAVPVRTLPRGQRTKEWYFEQCEKRQAARKLNPRNNRYHDGTSVTR